MKENLNLLDGRKLALLNYVSCYDKERVFTVNGLYTDYPFAKHLFASDAVELEDVLAGLADAGFLVLQDASLKTYRLSPELDSAEVWSVVLGRLINIERSFVRDRMLTLMRDIPLHDFLELEQFQGNRNLSDPFLSAFADDLRVGNDGWWKIVCRLANLYDSVDQGGAVSELLFYLVDVAALELAGEDDANSAQRIDEKWAGKGIVDLRATLKDITAWKESMVIQVILVRGEELSIERRDEMKGDALKALLHDAAIAHTIMPVGNPDKRDQELLESTQLIIFTPDDYKEIAISKRPAGQFKEMLRQRMDIELLSPYQTTGFVSDTMFYGRKHELRMIAAKPKANFAIYGGRRRGKTSLMKRLEALYHDHAETENPAVFVDCELVSCEEDFLAALCGSLEMSAVKSYGDFIAAEKKIEPGLLLLVDEIDHAFASCDPKRLIGVLRNLSEEHGVRCVLAGTTELYRQFKDMRSPMYNFAEPLLLGPFTDLEAMDLAKDPMHSLGVVFEDGDSTVRRLINMCGRFPNLIQLMCHQLVKRLTVLKSRTIVSSMLDEVFEGGAFGEYVEQQFQSNFNPYQKLVVYSVLMVKSLPLTTITQKVQERYDLEMSKIEVILDDLVLLFVLRKTDSTYSWVYEQFPQLLKRRTKNVNFRIKQLVKEIKDHADVR